MKSLSIEVLEKLGFNYIAPIYRDNYCDVFEVNGFRFSLSFINTPQARYFSYPSKLVAAVPMDMTAKLDLALVKGDGFLVGWFPSRTNLKPSEFKTDLKGTQTEDAGNMVDINTIRQALKYFFRSA